MSIRFDEKGKFFTDVISKETVHVIIQTVIHQIHGTLHVRPNERLRDEINRSEQFIAITNASIMDNNGKLLYQCEFFAINVDQIIWILPESEIIDANDNDGGAS